MTTKEQERKALEQIKKIISGLGADSYIATAMDGMIEDAEENIENDFAVSMKDRWQTAEKRLADLSVEYNKQMSEMAEKIRKAYAELDLAKQSMKQEAERANFLADEMGELRTKLNDANEKVDEFSAQNELTQAENDKLKDEIIRLKAKLYDLMVK